MIRNFLNILLKTILFYLELLDRCIDVGIEIVRVLLAHPVRRPVFGRRTYLAVSLEA